MTATDSTATQGPLPADLAERFIRDGYVVVDDLVTAEERGRIVDDAAGFIDGTYPVSNPPDDGDILAVHFPHWVSPVAHDAVVHPGIAEVVGTIAGAHLPGWDGRTKCMQSMLFFKPPGLQGQAWHQDERFIPTRDRSLVGAWIALDDATVDNGCLWVQPGGHRSPLREIFQVDWAKREGKLTDLDSTPWPDHNQAVAVEVPAGSMVIFQDHMPHYSSQNRSDCSRHAFTLHVAEKRANWSDSNWLQRRTLGDFEL